jgi:hypothetical protein
VLNFKNALDECVFVKNTPPKDIALLSNLIYDFEGSRILENFIFIFGKLFETLGQDLYHRATR